MILEVCTEGVQMSMAAEKAGATRLELCASLAQGGLTPSYGTLEMICKHVNIPVHVMIRPRAGDFMYSDEEFETMMADVKVALRMGVEGVVFGILDADGMIDRERCAKLIEAAGPMKKVFHRAFDMSADPYKSFIDLQELGFNILLTSGRRQTAVEGIEVIRQLVIRNTSDMEIMAGSGVSPSNAARLASIGVNALHFTCKKSAFGSMKYFNRELQSMGSNQGDEYALELFDEQKFNAILDAVQQF